MSSSASIVKVKEVEKLLDESNFRSSVVQSFGTECWFA
jgi:hypothetical protein